MPFSFFSSVENLMEKSTTQMKLCVMISGSGSNLQSLIDTFPNDEKSSRAARVALVVSDNPGAYGLERAKSAGIETAVISPKQFESKQEFGLAHLELFRDRGIELIVLAGYLKLIPANMIEEYRNRMINIHPALLPSFGGKGMYGRKVHAAVIESGAKISGATVHFVDEKYDHGPILLQYPVQVYYSDTPEELAARILRYEHMLLPLAVHLIAMGRVSVRENRVYIDGEERLDWAGTYFLENDEKHGKKR
jgi:phosphoribosylglycinamide formyltransferase-1